MNPKHYLYLIAVVSLLLTGCDDLNRYPYDKINSGTFWKTEADAKKGILGVYQKLIYASDLFGGGNYGMLFAMDCMSDIGTGYDEPGYFPMQTGKYTAYNKQLVEKWQSCYDGVQAANMVIRNVRKSADIPEEVKAKVIGEAKFLRSLWYFHLMDFWGGVPIYDENTNIAEEFNDMNKPRSTKDEVMAFILRDLTDAVGSLPTAWPQADYGRATKGAAYAMRGKMYLFAKDYDKAIADFEEIVKNTGTYHYALYPDYVKLFLPKEIGGGDESNEIIFAIQTRSDWGQRAGIPTVFFMGSRSAYGWSWNCCMPSARLVDMYELKDGRKFDWDEFIPGYNDSQEVRDKTYLAKMNKSNTKVEAYPEYRDKLLAMYDKRDPRMRQSIILPYDFYKGYLGLQKPNLVEFVIAQGLIENYGFIRSNYPSAYHYLWRKMIGEENIGGLLQDKKHSPINFAIIRYADVLLMLAECYNERGRYDEAVALINRVRSRPSTNMPGINSGPAWLEARDHDAIFERIVHERAVELAGEGLRFSDIKRWGLAEKLLNIDEMQITGVKAFTRSFKARDYLWPVPGKEIEMNPALLPNNPGW